MEHESFENPEIAAVMNEHYVNIKVDREERPDVDQLYMTFVQVWMRLKYPCTGERFEKRRTKYFYNF